MDPDELRMRANKQFVSELRVLLGIDCDEFTERLLHGNGYVALDIGNQELTVDYRIKLAEFPAVAAFIETGGNK